jgi:diacylglycerol kinase family enzyme
LINPRSGSGSPSAEDLLEEARDRGIEARILGSDDDPAELAREAETNALGVAGGDGSLAAVAEVAVERDLPFVCIPLGTRNHFARDLGLDRDDPVAALDAFEGTERRVDVGRVGDQVFLNNVSIGVYAELVHRREKHRRRRNAFAQLRALLLLARNPGGEHMTVDGEPVEARLAFVGNNAYKVELFSLGERERLDEGLLHLYVVEAVGRWALVALLAAAAWRGSAEAEGLVERASPRLTVESRRARLHAAIDGEPAVLEQPLELEIRPRALRALVPPA